MEKFDIAGLRIDALTKNQLLSVLLARIKSGQKTFLTTPYSEFLHAALLDPEVMRMLNTADIAVPDGIGLFWAARFLSIPLTAKSYWGKVAQAVWQVKYTLAAILLRPQYIRSTMPEKISGADLVWDLAKLAADEKLSIYLLGGFGNTPKGVSEKLKVKSEKLSIAGYSSKDPDDPTVIDDIKKAAPDILLVAYGPIRQERWIAANLPDLPVKLAVGLGGTFDYLAGKVPNPPTILRHIGLEWLWRLFTQPHRAGRIYNAFFGLISAVLRYKVFTSLPYRPNVATIVLNRNHEILIARFNPEKKALQILGFPPEHMKNFWQFPQGGMEPGESIEQAAKRELLEETGIHNGTLLKISPSTNRYDWRNKARRPLFVGKRYQFSGQQQNIVYFKFLGTDADIKLDYDELLEFKWAPLDKVTELVHPEKISIARIAQTDLKEMQEKGTI